MCSNSIFHFSQKWIYLYAQYKILLNSKLKTKNMFARILQDVTLLMSVNFSLLQVCGRVYLFR